MGATLFRQTLETQIDDIRRETALPEDLAFLSHKKLDEDFDRLYLETRELLHTVMVNPSDELLKNINRYQNTNSKFLSDCFNEAASCSYDLMELVTDRLTQHDATDQKVPKTETRFRDRCLPSTMNERRAGF